MKTGVVIVTYNRCPLLKECLECVRSQTHAFEKVILVNNCSTDDTPQYLDSLADWPALVRLDMEENLGGAGGFYQGLKAALPMDLDLLLIIDDDAMIEADYMAKILDFAEKHPEIPGFAGSVWTEGRIDLTHRRNIGSRLLFTEAALPETEYEKEGFPCDCATFCGLVIRGTALQEIGLPLQEYFLWYDDSEFCLRLMDLGGITVVPAAKLNHKTKLPESGTSLLMRTSWRHYYGYRNRYDCGLRHFGKFTAAMIALQYRVFLLASRLMLLSPSKREHAAFNLKMISDALSDGKAGRLGYREEYHR